MKKGIHVVFDAYELARGRGKSIGIYTYAKNLLGAMSANVPEGCAVTVACHGDNVADFGGNPSGPVRQLVLSPSTPGQLQRQMWMRIGASREVIKQQADVYFSPKGFLPGVTGGLRGAKSVVVLHDLIPLWYADNLPRYFGLAEEMIVGSGLRRTARWADRVIAISEATASELKVRLGRAAAVDVVHNGLPTTPASKIPLNSPYIFVVGSALPHKNFSTVLAAYRMYRQRVSWPLPLVVCGMSDIDEPGVHAVGRVTDAELHGYYAGCSVFLFLSLIEGFGFPPLEALSHGARVIASDIPVMRELGGDVIQYVEPLDAEAVARSLVEALDEPADSDYSARARAVADGFCWDRCANGVWRSICAAARV